MATMAGERVVLLLFAQVLFRDEPSMVRKQQSADRTYCPTVLYTSSHSFVYSHHLLILFSLVTCTENR
jgi:hypothetical protein